MFRVRIQKLGSLFGLLAILMTVLAPTVSHALASHQQLGSALAAYCSVEGTAEASTPDDKSGHSAAPHWQACAYCSLLAHVPTLPGGGMPLAIAPLLARIAVADAQAEVRATRVYTAALPRAPPAFS